MINFYSKQIPALKQVAEKDRLKVFKSTFKSPQFKLFLLFIFILLMLVLYLNLEGLLSYGSTKGEGIITRVMHLLKALGVAFYLELVAVASLLVFGRNYFVTQEVKKYVEQQDKSRN